MPDPTKRTISATQSPALFNVSPYVTRWMLWQNFANGVEIDPPEDGRMSWGKKLQPLLIQQAMEDLKLEARPNEGDVYHRAGLLGCTRDGTIICPDRGPGALETKCVFDYRTWMADWEGGRRAPKHYEIQLQQQMLVGDGRGPFKWGVLAAWVAGEMHYFERAPIHELWNKIGDEARSFFVEVDEKREPDPFGVTVELPWLTKLLPVEKGKVIDLSDDSAGRAHAELAVMYKLAKDQEAANARTAEPLRAQILALARDAEEVLLPHGIAIRVRPHGKGKVIKIFNPNELAVAERAPRNILAAG